MDYIREELLRQKKVLAVLMSGGTREQGDADRTEAGMTAKSDSIWQELAASTHERGWEEGGLDRAKRSFFREPMRSDGKRVPASELGDAMNSAIRTNRNDRPDVLRIPGYVIPYERFVVGESADVRAVSRGIQRDARRYDGGFSIY